MPSVSQKQHNLMAGVANNPSFAKKVGIDRSVGEEYLKADRKDKSFMGGSSSTTAKVNKQNTNHGKMDMPFSNLNKLAGKRAGGPIMKGSARTRKFGDGGTIERLGSDQSFGSAFKEAKGAGASTFTWKGKKYTTETAGSKRPDSPSPSNTSANRKSQIAESKTKYEQLAGQMGKMPAGTAQSTMDALRTATQNEGKKFADLSAEDAAYKKGGRVKTESKAMVKKEVDFFKKKGAPKNMIKHEESEMNSAKYARGGGVRGNTGYQGKGQLENRPTTGNNRAGENPLVQKKGLTEGRMVKMATGGVVKFARGGGIESRGKTRGRVC
jgi:hypothetical protein